MATLAATLNSANSAAKGSAVTAEGTSDGGGEAAVRLAAAADSLLHCEQLLPRRTELLQLWQLPDGTRG